MDRRPLFYSPTATSSATRSDRGMPWGRAKPPSFLDLLTKEAREFETGVAETLLPPLEQVPKFGDAIGRGAAVIYQRPKVAEASQKLFESADLTAERAKDPKLSPEQKRRLLAVSQGASEQANKMVQELAEETPTQEEIVRGAVGTAGTVVAGSGAQFLTLPKVAAMGLLGGGVSKVFGGDFTQGAGRMVGMSPYIMGAVGATDPAITAGLGKIGIGGLKGMALRRGAAATMNVIQGWGIDIAAGQKIGGEPLANPFTGEPITVFGNTIGMGTAADIAVGLLMGPKAFLKDTELPAKYDTFELSIKPSKIAIESGVLKNPEKLANSGQIVGMVDEMAKINKEFAADPRMLYDSGNIYFKGDKTMFKFNPEAMFPNSKVLKKGLEVTLLDGTKFTLKNGEVLNFTEFITKAPKVAPAVKLKKGALVDVGIIPKDGKPFTVQVAGYDTDVPGFQIIKAINPEEIDAKVAGQVVSPTGKGWQIVHTKSGALVGTFSNQGKAKAALATFIGQEEAVAKATSLDDLRKLVPQEDIDKAKAAAELAGVKTERTMEFVPEAEPEVLPGQIPARFLEEADAKGVEAKGVEAKDIEVKGVELPKELEPLAREARKYESSDKFIEAFDENLKRNELTPDKYKTVGGTVFDHETNVLLDKLYGDMDASIAKYGGDITDLHKFWENSNKLGVDTEFKKVGQEVVGKAPDPRGLNISRPAKNATEFGQYKLETDPEMGAEVFSEVRLIDPEEAIGRQYTVDAKIVNKYKQRIIDGKPIEPIIIKNQTVIDGYHTAQALASLGYKKYPAIFVELDIKSAQKQFAADFPGRQFDEAGFRADMEVDSIKYEQFPQKAVEATDIRTPTTDVKAWWDNLPENRRTIFLENAGERTKKTGLITKRGESAVVKSWDKQTASMKTIIDDYKTGLDKAEADLPPALKPGGQVEQVLKGVTRENVDKALAKALREQDMDAVGRLRQMKSNFLAEDIQSIQRGQPIELFHGKGGEPTVKTRLDYPVLGKGKYYAFTEGVAKDFGDTVEKVSKKFENPLFITKDDELMSLFRKAGAEELTDPARFDTMTKGDAIKNIDAVNEYVKSQGHDALVVKMDPMQETRSMSRILDTDQVLDLTEAGKRAVKEVEPEVGVKAIVIDPKLQGKFNDALGKGDIKAAKKALDKIPDNVPNKSTLQGAYDLIEEKVMVEENAAAAAKTNELIDTGAEPPKTPRKAVQVARDNHGDRQVPTKAGTNEPPDGPPPGPKPQRDVSTSRQIVEDMMDRKRQPPAFEWGKKQVEDLRDGIMGFFTYRKELDNYKAFRNDARKLQDVSYDAKYYADDNVKAVVRGLTKEEMRVFTGIVVMEDLVDSGQKGLELPRNFTVDQADEVLREFTGEASPEVLEAVERSHNLFGDVHTDLVKRGKLDPADVMPRYYPHRILDYVQKYDFAPWMQSKIKTPYRYYTKRRFGSIRDIDFDYEKVVSHQLSKVYIDNAIDDFFVKSAIKYDVMPKLKKIIKKDPGMAQKIFKNKSGAPIPNGVYEIDGVPHRGYQYKPGNVTYLTNSVNEDLWQQALDQDLTLRDFEQMAGPRGGAAIKESMALGGKHKIYILPEPIYDTLNVFRTKGKHGKVISGLKRGTSAWKGVTLTMAGIPFQINNFIGDAINGYMNDPELFLSLPDANKLLREAEPDKLIDEVGKTGLSGRKLLSMAQEERGIGGRTIFLGEYASTGLRKPQGFNPLEWYNYASSRRENTLRMAKFIKDMERVNQGGVPKMPKGVVDDLVKHGLTMPEIAGYASRETFIDYGAVSDTLSGGWGRGFLFPFATFYTKNAQKWAKYVVKNPMDATIKFGIPLAAMWTWNNSGSRRQLERNLPDYYKYIPHITTGWQTDDGKTVTVGFQTPIDLAAQMFGLDRLPEKIALIKEGRMTAEEAAKEQVKDTVFGPFRTGVQLLNPLVKTAYELTKNRNTFTDAPIVPPGLEGTEAGRNLMIEHAAKNMVTPYGMYMTQYKGTEYKGGSTVLGYGLDLLMKKLGIRPDGERAVGASVDMLKRATGLESVTPKETGVPIPRVFGGRATDPRQTLISNGYRYLEEQDAAKNQIKAEIVDLYLDSMEADDPDMFIEGLRELIEEIKTENIILTPDQIMNSLQTEGVKRQAMNRLLRKTKDPLKRQQIYDQKLMSQLESLWKSAEVAERDPMMKKVITSPEDLQMLFGGEGQFAQPTPTQVPSDRESVFYNQEQPGTQRAPVFY